MTDGADQYSSGPQWNNIVKRLSVSTVDFSNLKRTPELMLFATFDPDRFGLGYLRTLIAQLYLGLDGETKKMLKNTKNRSLGNPFGIKVDGDEVDLDYIQSASEAAFIQPKMATVKTVVEIGAGYGRTCHTIISNFKQIQQYCIVDLAYSAQLSSAYLKMVLPPEDYAKIMFITTDQVAGFFSMFTDHEALFINIDSMAEMSSDVVKNYLSLIDRHGRYFFSKNSVGKYKPEDMGEKKVRPVDFKDAVNSGLLPEVIDVFDLDDIRARVPRYLETYTPGKQWKLARQSESDCYVHYHFALYEKN